MQHLTWRQQRGDRRCCKGLQQQAPETWNTARFYFSTTFLFMCRSSKVRNRVRRGRDVANSSLDRPFKEKGLGFVFFFSFKISCSPLIQKQRQVNRGHSPQGSVFNSESDLLEPPPPSLQVYSYSSPAESQANKNLHHGLKILKPLTFFRIRNIPVDGLTGCIIALAKHDLQN